MSDKEKRGANRRDFLKLATTSAPAALAAATLAPTDADAAQPATGETRLQDTAHTRAYFDSARF
ncbi:ubiquinol-cytochrome c reductase iron-sulfur subunit N-terminal domain-containing protein [Rhodovulum sp. YNF3179]|uniref:ubiquinol-cytochrome c reductase iron-sulfur subunit N-terminal domain-containing protein n=1 Tax=Rhodovulum sp. YNF3179 TaxID=3425127 RepID=UPI003D34B9F2